MVDDKKKRKPHDGDKNQSQYLNALSRESAVGILVALCRESDLSDRIVAMAKATVSRVDSDKIAVDVYNRLNSIRVEDLWDNSGRTRYGYNDPTDVAYEMLDDQISVFTMKMNQFRDLGMYEQEKEYCKGILAGVLKYGIEGRNEFRDWAPDDPFTIADDIIDDWKENHSEDDIEEIQALYDSFFNDKTDE